jgi:glc operon protein GlcG
VSSYIQTPTITFEAARNAVEVAIAEGAKVGVRAVVTVVDPAMTMVAFGKADGATPHSVETSRRKANTAASTRRATGWMSESFALQLPLGTNGALTNILGGYPLRFDGLHVGGIGVAGGTPDQDAAIAEATLAAIGATDA